LIELKKDRPGGLPCSNTRTLLASSAGVSTLSITLAGIPSTNTKIAFLVFVERMAHDLNNSIDNKALNI